MIVLLHTMEGTAADTRRFPGIKEPETWEINFTFAGNFIVPDGALENILVRRLNGLSIKFAALALIEINNAQSCRIYGKPSGFGV